MWDLINFEEYFRKPNRILTASFARVSISLLYLSVLWALTHSNSVLNGQEIVLFLILEIIFGFEYIVWLWVHIGLSEMILFEFKSDVVSSMTFRIVKASARKALQFRWQQVRRKFTIFDFGANFQAIA